MGGHAADLRQQGREARVALEEVLDGHVERPRVGMLVADRLADHRRVRRQRAGVVGDEQRAAVGGDVLDPLDLAAEPVAVEELDERRVEDALDPLRPAPVVDAAIGLDRRAAASASARARRRRSRSPASSSARVPGASDVCLGGIAESSHLQRGGSDERTRRPVLTLAMTRTSGTDGERATADAARGHLPVPADRAGRRHPAGRARSLRRPRSRLAGDRLAAAPAHDRDRRRPRSTTPRSARGRRSSSSTGSAAAGRTGSRTCRGWPSSAIRAIALDLPGFGSSPMPPWQISIPDYGELLGDFREALELGTCTLVGNSMGGFIAAEVAVGEPEWVERLVLVSSAGISHATMRRGPGRRRRPGERRSPTRCCAASTSPR